MSPLARIIIFSLIEAVVSVVALILWLKAMFVLSIVVWVVGFTVEHILAWNSAKNRPLLSFPKD